MMHLTPLFLILLFFKTAKYVHTNETDASAYEASCEKDWDQFGEHCYKLEGLTVQTQLPWRGASARCSELGGHLASIHSKEENEFLTNSYATKRGLYVWIGLHSLRNFSAYQWDDGSPKDFENWARNEPNSLTKHDLYCAVLIGNDLLSAPGEWMDWVCGIFKAFICKKKFSPKMTTVLESKEERSIAITQISPKMTTVLESKQERSIAITQTSVHTNEMQTPDIKAPCEKDWDQFGEHCYKFEGVANHTPLSWVLASDRCSDLGGHLASIHSTEENEFISNSFGIKNETYVWIGLYTSGNSSLYQWDDGSPTDFLHWAEGEPYYLKKYYLNCVAMTDIIGEPGEWIGWNCNYDQPYICKKKFQKGYTTERPPVTTVQVEDKSFTTYTNETGSDDFSGFKVSCEKGWDQFGEHCYKLEGVTANTSQSWKGASSSCSELGGHLASIHSIEENEFLTNSYAIKNETYVWIGLYDSGNLSLYQWSDGSPTDFQHWAEGEPHYSERRHLHCAAVTDNSVFGEPGEWIDWNCDYEQPYICKKKVQKVYTTERPPVTTVQVEDKSFTIRKGCASERPPVTTVQVEDTSFTTYTNEMRSDDISDYKVSCEKEWEQFGEHCYKLEGITFVTRLSWSGASARCSELGGHLASIHSKEENEFLTNSYAISNQLLVWIALYATADSFIYKWEDGSPTDFKNWAKNEPRLLQERDLYCAVVIGDDSFGEPGEWMELACGSFKAFICKKKIQKAKVSERGPVTTIQIEEKFSTISMDETTPECQDEITTMISVNETPEYQDETTRSIIKDESTAGYQDKIISSPHVYTNGKENDDSSYYKAPCEKEWEKIGQHCYKLEGDRFKAQRTWRESAARCSELDGHLASIHSEEENDFLAYLIERYDVTFAWIGLHSIGNLSIYEWDDGSPTGFTNFVKNGQSALEKDELYCAALTDGSFLGEFGQWAELNCNGSQAFICKKKIQKGKVSKRSPLNARQVDDQSSNILMKLKSPREQDEVASSSNISSKISAVLVSAYLNMLLLLTLFRYHV